MSKYSNRWFRKVSDEELRAERERIRLQYCSPDPNKDMEEAARLFNLLRAFDRELSRRAWGDETPRPPSYHSEHGWYLSEDD